MIAYKFLRAGAVGPEPIDGRQALAAERCWQGDWLRQRLELEDVR